MSRKKLSDVEQAFLASEQTAQPQPQQPTQQPVQQQQASKPLSTDDAMSLILSPPTAAAREASTRFTADLPDSLHERLSLAAIRAKKTKVQLVREILNKVLPE